MVIRVTVILEGSNGLLDTEEFGAIEGDVAELARSIVSEVESAYGM
ncbi:hypothetical protein ACFTTN_35520 [Streptomyces niveus]